jgi:Transposase
MPSMTDPDRSDQTTTSDEQIILGVDTHKDVHVAAVITVLGVQLATAEFATTRVGYRRMLVWARNFGVLRRAGVEGTGSYGAALTRYLRRHDVGVVEVNRPDRATRRRRGKTAIDAVAAAHAVLSGRATTTAKTSDGPVEMLRMFKLARASAVKARTQAINQLKAVIVGADPALRETLTTLSNTALIRHCATLPDTPPRDVATATTYTLRRLAHRIQALTPRGPRPATADHHAHRSLRTDPAAAPRRRPGQRRRAAHHRRRQPRPARQRGVLCRPLRRHTDRSLIRRDHTASTQPRRRPTRQRRPLPHHPQPPTPRPTHPRLPRPTHHPRPQPPRSHTLRQTLHRPRDLPPDPPTQHHQPRPPNSLTNIGASAPSARLLGCPEDFGQWT